MNSSRGGKRPSDESASEVAKWRRRKMVDGDRVVERMVAGNGIGVGRGDGLGCI